MKSILHRTEVIRSINPHLLTILPLQEYHEIDSLLPIELLCGDRFDLMSKYIYGKLRRLDVAKNWRLHVYISLQKIFGFREGDGSGKNSQFDYLIKFDEILESIKTKGFVDEFGFLPVGFNNVLIDGAHRLAASLLYGHSVRVLKFDFVSPKYDYKYFLTRGLPIEVADSMALEFCRLSPNMVIAVVFPVALGKDDEIRRILNDYGRVAYTTQIVFSEIGRYNLIRQLYRGESWIGSDGEVTPGLYRHVTGRFSGKSPVKFYFILKNNTTDIRDAKGRIRELFGLQNDSIHINDTHEETVRIAEQTLVPNSVHFLNHAQPWLRKNFLDLFKEYKKQIEIQNLDKEKYCVDSGSVLAAYGLRDTNDLDYLHLGPKMILAPDAKISEHNGELHYHETSIGDILFDPNNYFYYDGMKFISLNQLRKMKTRRNEAKDIMDILLIDSLIGDMSDLHKLSRRIRFLFKKTYELFTHFQPWQLKYLIPEFFHPIAKKIYHALFYFKETFGPFERKTKYKGFVLNYSKGTSLIYRIRHGETYEPELTWRIMEALRKSATPVFMDIGSNIGLVTLNVLASFPVARIFAFEPGPHQYSLFRKTILENSLQDNVILSNYALSFETGEVFFSIHHTKDSSGDGFIDTGRAGKIEKIKVSVTTLDHWWLEMGKPQIDVVKIDAEGAEHWILMGGVEFLHECRPIVFLEISEENLKKYPYVPEDIIRHLNNHGYVLLTLNGVVIYADDMKEVIKNNHDFMATPR